MDVLDLSAEAARSTSVTPAAPRAARREAQGDGAGRFAGAHWTYRAGFERVLSATKPEHWANPGQAGWRLVKHNARREVWRATLDGASYYLKYYLAGSWRDRLKVAFRGAACAAEWNGGLYALRAGIPAIRPVGFTPLLHVQGKPCSLLVSDAVEPAQPLADFWRTLLSDDHARRGHADRQSLTETLAEMIARAHQAGFAHLDMHASNVLVQTRGPRRYQTVFVDLQCARLGAALSDAAVVRNLAQLNQWFRRHAAIGDRLRFLRAYLRWRNEYEHAFPHGRRLGFSFEGLVAALADAAARHAEALWARRDRAALREGRYFGRVRAPGGWRGMALLKSKRAAVAGLDGELPRAWWAERLAKPLALLNGAGEELKNSHSAAVARASLPAPHVAALEVIVKRPVARNWRRRLRGLLAPSRCRRGWRVGHALANRDLPTARPLAYLERRFGPFSLDAILLTERLPDALDLDAFLRAAAARHGPREWLRTRLRLAEALAGAVRQLQEAGFVHRDCKAQNILVRDGAAPQLFWIDLDGLSRPRHLSEAQRLAPLMRLHVSLLEIPGLSRSDRVRFLKTYCARFGAAPDAWRAVWRALEPLVRHKLASQPARRAWKLRQYGRA